MRPMREASTDAAIKWAVALEPNGNDYLHNLHVIASVGCLDYKGAGLAASMLAAFDNATQRDTKRAEIDRMLKPAAERGFVGIVGERMTIKLRLLYPPRAIETAFGASHIHTLADETGNSLVWFASSAPDFLRVGATVECLATIKAHDVYTPRDGKPAFKQTAINRVALFVPKVKKPRAKRTEVSNG